MNNIFTILITDDNPENIKVLSELLKPEGYRIRVALNGQQAIKSIDSEAPDMVLMDIQMPKMDGYEACRRIKYNKKTKQIPIIFISAMGETFNKVKAFKAGAVDYLTKPFQAEEVLARVKTHLNLYNYQRQLQDVNLNLFKQFKSTFEQAAVGICHVKPEDGQLLKVNNRFASMLGYSKDEISSLSFFDIVHSDYLKDEIQMISDLIGNNFASYNHELMAKCKDYSLVWLKITASLIYNVDGMPDYLVGIVEDITDRKKAEQALKESEERFKLAVKAGDIGIWDWDVRKNILIWDETLYKLYGMKASDFNGAYEAWTQTLHPDDIENVQINIDMALSGEKEFNTEYRIITPQGKIKTMRAYGATNFDDDGKANRMVGVNIDVTEIRNANFRLQASEQRLKEAQGMAKLGNWELDLQSNKLTWSEEIFNIFDIESEEFEDTYEAFLENVHPDDRERVDREYQNHVKKNEPYDIEHRILLKDGTIKYVHENGYSIFNEDGDAIKSMGTTQDITEKMIAEQEILKLNRELEDRVRRRTIELENEKKFTDKLINSLPGIFYTFNKNGILRRWNNNYQKLIGLNNEDMNQVHIIETLLESDREIIGKAMQRVYEEGMASEEGHIISKDGKCVPYYLTGARLKMNEDDYIVGVGFDITERKEMEQELKEAKENAESATQAKSDFLANMSHEIRTPMNAIIGLSHLASKTELDTKQRDYVDKINMAGQNLLGIINDILDFSKIEAGKLTLEVIPFDLKDVVVNLSTIIAMKAQEKGLELIIDIDTKLPKNLIGDPLRLGQILLNLANNAIKFTASGEVVIKIEKLNTEDAITELKFSVIDTGIGLTEDQQSRLFKSFQQADASTTRNYGGSGLGLAISKGFVEMMNGVIGVESEFGKGSTFYFTARFGVHKSVKVTVPMNIINLKVLIVEDNESTIEVMKNYLLDFQFEVDTATSGEQALELTKHAIESNKAMWDLIIMDWMMPGIDGFDTTRQIRELLKLQVQPKVIMATNYGREDVIKQANELMFDGIIIKPITQSILYDSILQAFSSGTVGNKTRELGKINLPAEFEKVRGAKILVVEDNEINRQVAVEILTDEGFFVETAINGKEAVHFILNMERHYDVVLMDLQMPILDGYQATRIIRSQIKTSSLPIIAMTADAMSGVRERILECGMDDYVTKPIMLSNFFTTLLKWIKPGDRELPATFVDNNIVIPEIELPFKELKGIDIKSGLHHTNGNKSLYINTIRKFFNNNQSTLANIKAALDNEDYVLSHRIIHTTKSVAGLIGALKLQAILKEFEIIVRNRDTKNIGAIMSRVEEELNLILLVIKPYVVSEDKVVKQQNKGTLQEMLGILGRLYPFVKKNKLSQSKKIAVELENKMWPDSYEKVISKLVSQIYKYKYDEAMKCIEVILNENKAANGQ